MSQPVSVNLATLTTKQSLSRYNLDSRLVNVINNGTGLESIYGQTLSKALGLKNVRSMHKSSIGRDERVTSGAYANSGNIYLCAGNEVWKIHGNGEMSNCAPSQKLQTYSGYISWAESQSQNTETVYLYFCDGSNLYRLNMLDIYPQIERLDNAMPYVNGTGPGTETQERAKPSFISFRGHRLLMTCRNANQFFYSQTDPDSKPTSEIFPPLNFKSTETSADNTLRVIGLDVLYAFGTATAEVWRDNNDAYDPYTTSINSNCLKGMMHPEAVAIYGNQVYYFDNYRQLCRMEGGRREILSDRANERIWDGVKFDNAFVIYTNGCFIACFQSSSSRFTMGYNINSGSISVLSCLDDVRAAIGEDLCDINGNLCRFDEQSHTMADGTVISKSIQTDVVHSLNRFILRSVEIDYSIKTVPDDNPVNNQAFLFVSPDGLNWRDARILSLDMHANTIKSRGFGICSKLQARILFTNANPVVFNSITFQTQGARK